MKSFSEQAGVRGDWRPSAEISVLRRRSELLAGLRSALQLSGAFEVETPILSHSATVDQHIESFKTDAGSGEWCYLHTSPEFPMKRLLAAGSGDIYFLGRVFRRGEAGSRHNPEFTMLEYYRVGKTLQQLMSDVTALLASVMPFRELVRVSYRELFLEHLGINPHTVSESALRTLVEQQLSVCDPKKLTRNDCLDLLFSERIEPALGGVYGGELRGVYVYDFPATMSALARLNTNAHRETVAERFELFVQGIELANGYRELTDADEQLQRFEAEQQGRLVRGGERLPYDNRLVDALRSGMPDCSGVAMGVDRLLMLMLNKHSVADVLAFDFRRA